MTGVSDVARPARPALRRLTRSGAIACLVAAVGTTALAATARAADVGMEVDGTAIPVVAFPWWTFVGAALGVVLARLLRDRRRFVLVTSGATVLSLVPAVAMPDGVGTRAVLVVAHVLAAAIVVPALARALPVEARGS